VPSLLVFLGLFISVFWIAWILAVRVTERLLLRQDWRRSACAIRLIPIATGQRHDLN